ncbi:transcriptional coactivator YAP1-like isoform X4 [Xiphophorus maculatus]|uniref:transcriptional coactivator YAP1-like isoform X4 n=1 Tax=Xiphophorus maculatus TaxID=8083 RepID=UPI000C6CA0F2|nr:transcriptional coactivator YAP1-like isoform X4 [Xiphophorus maculatus]XP_027887761.1 transcriptional coactivator YAP1-like isoform X4 [Xiphophorus couchianus]XP_032432159.1 transcriptional coactivator YAP1-like isoform X4 [Xiphophorus hellerii]
MDAHRGAPPAGQQVVHVRGDSKTELEALFNAVMNPSKATRQPPSVPMRMRKFPDSFFKPPEPRGHSRQASSDGGLCGSLAPHHVRAHSSPASLPVNSLSAQADADAAATPIIPDDVPLPDGWEMAKTSTGQRYFINHVHRTTTWQDPRLSQLQSAAAQHQIACTPSHAHSFSNPAPTTQPKNIVPETAPKVNPAILSLAMQQRLEKLRLKQGIPPQFAPQLNETKHTRIQVQEAGGSNQMPGGMDHDRSAQMLVPSVDIRIRALNQEPNLNGAHSRNESTDSGLSVSSLSRTSDHMLSSVDHMDTGDSSEPPSMGLQESMPVLPINEDLMPGIPDSLTSDMLMEMDTVLSGPHMDRDSLLTWL